MSFLTNVVKVLEALGIKNKSFNDKRYINTTGDTMTGGLTIQPATNTLTALVVNDKDANNVLTVDTVNDKVGIGTTNPGTLLNLSGSSYSFAAGGLSFGDADTGFYEAADDVLYYQIGGISRWKYTGDKIIGIQSGMQIQAGSGVSTTAPRYSFYDDTNTGIGIGDTDSLNIITGGTEKMRIDSLGKVGIGTTSPTVKLQINSIASYESATLGSELLSANNWTLGTGWSGDFTAGFAHTSGTADLSNTLAGVIGNYYQITYTVTGRTAGSFTITFGGQSYSGRTATGTFGPRATTTGNLIITPTTDFNGTVIISIKQITANYGATFALNDSTGNASFEIRNSLASLNNTFIGKNAGARNTTGYYNSAQGVYALFSNTTGYNNSAQGYAALYNNTTGSYNSAQGVYALFSNTTGSSNSAQGYAALQNNTTGYNNSAQGVYALYSNTTGSNNSAQGVSALFSNTTGYNNSAQGTYALQNNTTGYNNSAQGVSALYNLTGGYNNNTAIGYNSGRYYNGTTGNLTSVSNSLFLGASASALANGSTNEIVIGYNAIGLGSNTIKLGNTSITNVASNGDFEALDIGDGFILKSPDGTRYRITVADGGALSAVAV